MPEVLTPRDQMLVQLEEFTTAIPQLDGNRNFRYLVACGFSVDFLIGRQRPHSDVEIALLDIQGPPPGYKLGSSISIEQAPYFWGYMRLEADFLNYTGRTTQFTTNTGSHDIGVVHPAITLIQKSTIYKNHLGQEGQQRQKDLDDSEKLLELLSRPDEDPLEWAYIMEASLAAVPSTERPASASRALSLITKLSQERWFKIRDMIAKYT